MEYQYEILTEDVKSLLQTVSSNPSYPNLVTIMLASELFSACSWEYGLHALEEAAENDLNLQYILSHFYMENEDYGNAMKWSYRAAIREYSWAQIDLAGCLLSGNGVEKDVIEAIFWLHQASHSHNPHAHGMLADCYKKGIGVNPDFGMGFHHFQEYQKYRNQAPRNKLLHFNDHTALETKSHLDKFYFFKNQERFEGETFNEKAVNEINVLVDIMLDNNYTFSSLQNYLIEKLGTECESDIDNKIHFLKYHISTCNPFEGKESLFDN